MSDKQHAVYPADDFDDPAQGPVGLHRGPRSFGARALPYLIVLVVAALCGMGLFLWLSGSGGEMLSNITGAKGATSSVSKSADAKKSDDAKSEDAKGGDTKSADASGSASETPSASETANETPNESSSPSESASESPSPSATVNKSSSVVVINGTRRSGLASQGATKLRNAGYASVSAQNPNNRSTLPSTSTVWYKTEADLATAQDVASRMGISQVVQVSGMGASVAVVLMQ